MDGQRFVVGAGEVHGAAPDGHTLYEIGSVTKVFTSVLLADAVVRGETTLETPLTDVLGTPVGAHEAGPIRLVDLATHTSGLPASTRRWTRPRATTLATRTRPTTPTPCWPFWPAPSPRRAPGEPSGYRNVAVGALGYALSQQAGTTYGALVADRVLRPLGMRETFLTIPDSLADRFATGGTDAEPITAWSFGEPTVGAGGLRSSVSDLLTFAQAALDPGPTPLADALALDAPVARRGGAGGRRKRSGGRCTS